MISIQKLVMGILFFLVVGILGCKNKTDEEKTVTIPIGRWRAVVVVNGMDLPFYLISRQSDMGDIQFVIKNDEEEIRLTEFDIKGDSLILPMHIFDTKIVAKISQDRLDGYWVKNYYDDYVLPFYAELNKDYRFQIPDNPVDYNFTGKWKVEFYNPEKRWPAIGEFEQDGNSLTGSFLTNSGDYRFLEGSLSENGFWLSTFDGEHAYVFGATLAGRDTIEGEYWSGKAGYYQWTAVKDENATLSNPYDIASINNDQDLLNLSLPNEYGDTISLSDEAYQDKVVIVQILGSWCANCMDETAFLSEWYRNNQNRRIEIVGLAFERKDDFEYGASRIKKLKERYDIDYEILFAGNHGKENVQKVLSMIENFGSFPTTIFIDKNGEIAKVHTGFNGPGTGEHYQEFVDEFNATVDGLLD